MANNSMNFDNTDYQKIDPITDFGKGIYYIGKDGKPYAIMKELEAANKRYWDNMMILPSHEDYVRAAKIEKEYFDIITPKFNNNDIDMVHQILSERREKMMAYIQARYGDYLDKLLEEIGYGKQDSPKGPRR